jgi:hypothetical protein
MGDRHDFDRRWQALVAAARQVPAQRAPLSDLHAARLAAQGLALAARQREAEQAWRGMALAASLFLACLLGLGAVAAVLVPPATVTASLALVEPGLPGTGFIPAPPRLPALASTAGAWAPARVFSAVGAWLDPRPSVPEHAP